MNMGLSHLERETFIDRRADRDLIDKASIGTGKRYCSTFSAGLDAFP